MAAVSIRLRRRLRGAGLWACQRRRRRRRQSAFRSTGWFSVAGIYNQRCLSQRFRLRFDRSRTPQSSSAISTRSPRMAMQCGQPGPRDRVAEFRSFLRLNGFRHTHPDEVVMDLPGKTGIKRAVAVEHCYVSIYIDDAELVLLVTPRRGCKCTRSLLLRRRRDTPSQEDCALRRYRVGLVVMEKVRKDVC